MEEKLKKIPFSLIFVAYLGYLGVQLYDFYSSPDGAVEKHKTEIQSSQAELTALKKKLAEGKKFLQVVENKKQDLRDLIKKLADYQGALSDALDVPGMMKTLLTEAKKLDLKVDKIEPGKTTTKEYYADQDFKLEVRGSYIQISIFTQRVAQMQRILRIENYVIKPVPVVAGARPGNQLNALLYVKAYQYVQGKEDKITVPANTAPVGTPPTGAKI